MYHASTKNNTASKNREDIIAPMEYLSPKTCVKRFEKLSPPLKNYKNQRKGTYKKVFQLQK